MSRKSIILCLIALAVMFAGIGVAVLLLYADVDSPRSSNKSHMAADDRHMVLSAVPSDAVLTACFSDHREVASSLIEGFETVEGYGKSRMAVSLHFSGKLFPLYVFEAKKDEAVTEAFTAYLATKGLAVSVKDGFVLASPSETIVKSSVRHLEKAVSILDATGFDKAVASVRGANALFISNAHMGRLIPAVLKKNYSGSKDFLTRFSDWTAFDLSRSAGMVSLIGTAIYDGDATDFHTVLEKSSPSVSAVSSVLPSYTLFAVSLPMKETAPYVDAYQSYLDTRQKLQTNLATRNALEKKYKVSPEDMAEELGIREVAAAFVMDGDAVEKITLMRTGRNAVYTDSVDYNSLASSLFGEFFARKGETETVFMDGWIISGGKKIIESYKEGEITEYSLKNLLVDTGKGDVLSRKASSAVAYFSFSAERSALKDIFTPSFLSLCNPLFDAGEVAPAVLSITHDKAGMGLGLELMSLSRQKSDEAVFERDTTVVVPTGPFMVKNSGTGKMNEFYQNSHKALCLREDGKDLWGIPFDKSICGRAGTVDFYANGKLQILFGAGSSIHLLDRLGRYVKGFPLDLKKDILLGPDIYDFTGKKKYNIMILHKDNTIEMYNLQGQKPASWKGIAVTGETIKNLPERIDLGGSTFWIVRTSVQTLIFPFYGGEALTVFEGNQKIRPDSEIKALDGTTVEFTCYDGKVRTQTLK